MKSHFKQAVESLEPQRLKYGDRGLPVKTLQQILQALSFYDGIADGDFGPSIEAAVSQFERWYGLTETGQFDVDTWYALTFWVDEPSPNAEVTTAAHVHQPSIVYCR